MKIALVHDYLIEAGGAERVLKVLSEMYPTAPIYTALAKNGTAKKMFEGSRIVESKWASVLKIGRLYSYLRFLLPLIWQSMNLREYDVIITSCSGYIARGFKVKDSAKVIAYCHTPPRWLYGYDTPTGADRRWWGQAFMWVMGPFMRYFDYKSAERVDTWIANSNEVKKRIAKYYRKEAEVVWPPIEISSSRIAVKPYSQNYYLMVSRIVGGKGIKEAVSAFKKLGISLKVVGEVVDQKLGARVGSMGRVDDEQLARLYREAKGFVALSHDEDFGMTVVESMAAGTPVLAYAGGGYLETVIEGKTGVLLNKITPEEIARGIKKMEHTKWNKSEIQTWARKFERAEFEKKVRKIVGV